MTRRTTTAVRRARLLTTASVVAAAALCWTGPVAATATFGTPPAYTIAGATITPHASLRLRGEFVDWFDPGPGAAPNDNNDYQFFASVAHFGGRIAHERFTLFVDGQHVAIVPLPDDAGSLGPGAVYRLNNRRDHAAEVFLREAYLSVPDLGVPGLALHRGGRFRYDAGLENIEDARDGMLAWLKKMRISQRLLGTFDYTHAGRSLDGGVLTYDRGPYNLTLLGGQPTAGGFDVSANPHIDGIFLTNLALTVTEPTWWPRSEMQLFYLYYDDARGLVATDNRPLDVRQADSRRDIGIHTIGGHLAKILAAGPGDVDTLLWAAGQTGDWQSQDHAAWGLAGEIGYRWRDVPWTPWVRGGYFRSSGDGDPGDGDHKTFFQVLPTARLYALTPFFNLMNNQDVFAQLVLKPLANLVVRTDYHYLEVASDADLLYAGGGAGSADRIFGYAGFPARGNESVAHLADLTVIWNVNQHLQFWVYYGHAFGERVIEAQFPRSQQLDYAYLESTVTW